MNEKELYLQKIQAEINEWKAQIQLFKAKAVNAKTDVKMTMHEDIQAFEEKVEEGKAKLLELSDSTESTFEAIKKTFETKWEIVKTAIKDTTKKLSA